MTMKYLWQYREQPKVFTKRWIKVWAKRVLNMPALLSIIYARSKYTFKGAKIGRLSVIGKLDINGSVKRLSIGERTLVASDTHLAFHDKITIGSRVVINDKVTLLTGSHDLNDTHWSLIAKPIIIDDYAWIAIGATILPGVRIGKGAVVGAGAVVSRNVPDYAIAVGNPAIIIDKKRCEKLDFSPVDLIAAYEAWIGRRSKL